MSANFRVGLGPCAFVLVIVAMGRLVVQAMQRAWDEGEALGD